MEHGFCNMYSNCCHQSQEDWRPSSRGGRGGSNRAGSNNSFHAGVFVWVWYRGKRPNTNHLVSPPPPHPLLYHTLIITRQPNTDDGTPAGQLMTRIRNGSWTGTLGDLRAEVLRVCKDQNGSRVIQQQMDIAPKEEVESLFDDLTPAQKQELVVDTFGNYVVQKFLDLVGVEAQDKILCVLRGNMVAQSCDQYGCRVVQKALQVCVDVCGDCGGLCGYVAHYYAMYYCPYSVYINSVLYTQCIQTTLTYTSVTGGTTRGTHRVDCRATRSSHGVYLGSKWQPCHTKMHRVCQTQ